MNQSGDNAPGIGGQSDDNSPSLASEVATIQAIHKLADAIESTVRHARAMSGIAGIRFTRWQNAQIRFWLWIGSQRRAQKVILRELAKAEAARNERRNQMD